MSKWTPCCCIVIVVAVLFFIVGSTLSIVFLAVLKDKDITPTPSIPRPNNEGPYKNAVVAADNGECSELGRDILKKNGSAVDGAITTMLCLGVLHMHSSGIGGGGFMLVYNRASKSADVIDFREKAPAAANATMYNNTGLNSTTSPSASGVPGEIRGYYTAHKRHGRLPWKELVQPVIDLANKGVKLSSSTFKAMNASREAIKNDPGLSELFVKKDGEFIKEGDIMNMTKLATTLKTIRDNPEDFYNGKLAEQIVKDIQDNGGIITLQDMKDYQPKIRKSVGGEFGDRKWYSIPPPGSGPVIALIINILKGYNMSSKDRSDDKTSILTYHRIIEAFKFAYAWRPLLGDMDFENVTHTVKKMLDPAFANSLREKINDNKTYNNKSYYGGFFAEDGGSTTHMSLLAPNGDAVAVTSTINLYFGCKYRSPTTGIIMNNQMDDFSTSDKPNKFGAPPSPANRIKPGKRPFSSATPMVITNKNGDVYMSTGASGGTTITTSTAQVIMNYMWFGLSLSDAVKDPRLHHQLDPMAIKKDVFFPFDENIIKGLKNLGHDFNGTFLAVVQAVVRKDDDSLYGMSDPRKGGHPAGF